MGLVQPMTQNSLITKSPIATHFYTTIISATSILSLRVLLLRGIIMKILGWNCTGINQSGQSESIHKLVHLFNPVVVGLVDTKHSRLTEETVKGWWKKEDKVSWVDVPETRSNNEKCRGLIFAWNELYFEKTKSLTNKRWLLVEGKLLQERIDVSFLLVAEPSCDQETENLRRDLSNLMQTISCPLMVMGSFNDGLAPEEKNLDFKALSDTKFSEHFKLSGMSGLETGLSDHCPIVVECDRQDNI